MSIQVFNDKSGCFEGRTATQTGGFFFYWKVIEVVECFINKGKETKCTTQTTVLEAVQYFL